jgi:predicted transcriptional regulator
MLVTFQPEGQDTPTKWEFQPEQVRQSQAELIEKRSGMTYPEWTQALGKGGSLARRVLLWHLMTRDGQPVRIEDLPDFRYADLKVDPSIDEMQRIREQIENSDETPENKALALEAVDAELKRLLGKESLEKEDLGKADSNSAD